ncbi:MAG: Mrp/NBP35 family ATP-binding protein [Bacteroidetes bacterium]|nr:Mrp/NBP35 family ATP-binding protein [Bacteroidota bacterium]MBT5528599.1 Mrp/NBP35 family ATP-binding protein [Cytophagia bacterium]MBT3423847.1 Mrp/NBP35 family ATP-binding protein [Bacteroidota bacterium]MBT3800872.1 Mrp/NBP35 family ATP-binding protein [Bacteroidota bacterium]MBT4340099.1 Mrp/NBP35 family ATP-binding protein [Bacteroidota bacterium]
MKDKILKALSNVIDPDLKDNLVKLKMIDKLKIEGNEVSFTIILTTPACPMKNMFKEECAKYIKEVDPNLVVKVDFDSKVEHTQRENMEKMAGVKNMIAVASGKGGVGKSTVAVNLALALAEFGAKVGLLDADMNGPSIPVMMGIEGVQPAVKVIDGKNMMLPIEKYGVKIMSLGSLVPQDKPIVWRGPMLSNGLSQLILDTIWDDLDYLIVDLPPGTGDIHITLCQNMPLSAALIVTTPQKVSLTDTLKTIEMFKIDKIEIPIAGIVENMSYFTPAELPDNKYYLFGKGAGETLANRYKVPLLGQLPLVMGVSDKSDIGTPVMKDDSNKIMQDSFRELAQKMAQQISIISAQKK